MYRVIFVENVLLHGQNGEKSKKVRVLGILQSDPGGCFWFPMDYFWFFFNRREILFSIIYLLLNGYLQNMDRFRVISEKFEKIQKFRGLSATKSCPPHFQGRKLRFGTPTPYRTALEKKYFRAINVSWSPFWSSIHWAILNIFNYG